MSSWGTWLAAKSASCFSSSDVPGNNDAVCPPTPIPDSIKSGRGSPLNSARNYRSAAAAESRGSMPTVRIGRMFSSGIETRSSSSLRAMRWLAVLVAGWNPALVAPEDERAVSGHPRGVALLRREPVEHRWRVVSS